MDYYSRFDYEKLMENMFQYAGRVNTPENTKKYFLNVIPFEDRSKNDMCFNSSHLTEEKAFGDPAIFSLLYVEFYMGDFSSPVFTFTMGEIECRISLFLNRDFIKEKEFKDLFPNEEIKLSSWRSASALFTSMVNTIISKGLTATEDEEEVTETDHC